MTTNQIKSRVAETSWFGRSVYVCRLRLLIRTTSKTLSGPVHLRPHLGTFVSVTVGLGQRY